MRGVLAAIGFLICFPGAAPLRGGAEVPFRFSEGLLWLEVTVPGQNHPLNFVLDSGAGGTVVSEGVARDCRLKLAGAESVCGVGTRAFARRGEGFLGEAGGRALPKSVLVLDLSQVSRACLHPIDGIVGVDFFDGSSVQLDFAAAKLRFLLPNELPAARGRVLPLRKRNGVWCAPAKVNGGATQWMRVDTGCDGALHWVVRPSKARGRTHGAAPGAIEAKIQSLAAANLRLGSLDVGEVPTVFHQECIFPGEGGLLGAGLLSRFRVTLDTVGRKLVLEEAEPVRP